jgi:hypothetical protein
MKQETSWPSEQHYQAFKGNSETRSYVEASERTPMNDTPTSPSSRYASSFIVLPHIPLQSPIHSVHTNVDIDNHVINLASDKRFGLVNIARGVGGGVEENTVVGGNLEHRHSHHTWDLFPWPHYSSSMSELFYYSVI